MQTPSRASIAVEAAGDGIYTVRCATAEMGQGAKAAIRKMAAELLDVAVEDVRCPDPDTEVVPYDTRTTSSRSTHMMSRALKEAVRDLEERGGRGFGEVKDEGGLDPDTGQGVASSHWHQGAAAAQIELDEETGKFRVVRLHAPVYAGKVVNPPAAELQNEGSMIMGLGSALFESNEFAEGQITNANFSDYNGPAMEDVPRALTHELLEREGAEVQGLGETALPPVPPAIGNALHSLGIQVTDLPMSAESVLEAVDARDGKDSADALAHHQPGFSANGRASGDGAHENVGEKVYASDVGPSGASGDGAARKEAVRVVAARAGQLLTSETSRLFFGTLGVGLLGIGLIRLLGRAAKRREVPSLPQERRRS